MLFWGRCFKLTAQPAQNTLSTRPQARRNFIPIRCSQEPWPLLVPGVGDALSDDGMQQVAVYLCICVSVAVYLLCICVAVYLCICLLSVDVHFATSLTTVKAEENTSPPMSLAEQALVADMTAQSLW